MARTWAHPEEVGLYRLIISEAMRFPQLAEIYRGTMSRLRRTLAAYLAGACGKSNAEASYEWSSF